MAKELRGIQFNITGTPNPDGSWDVKASATLTVGLSEYPEFNQSKGIPIILTATQEATIKKFVKDVVIPQAEEKK